MACIRKIDQKMGVSDSAKKQHSPKQKKNQKRSPAINRPESTNLFQCSFPQTVTSYAEDYGPKQPVKTEISDFSTENKRNNPHPKETFMSWRLPSRFPPLIEGRPLSHSSCATELEGCLKLQKLKAMSTYQDDYATLQKGLTQLQVADELPPLSEATDTAATGTTSTSADTTTTTSLPLPPPPLPPSSGSEMREAYKSPHHTQHLKGNTSRYGCSSNYVKAACGIVPTLHPIANAPNYQTWYANEFGVGTGSDCGIGDHRRLPTPIYPLRLPPIFQDRTQLVGKLARPRPDKHGNGITSIDGKRAVKSSVKSAKKGSMSAQGAGGLSWLSGWAGPM